MKDFNAQMNLLKEEAGSFANRLSLALIPVLAQFNRLLADKDFVNGFSDALKALGEAAYSLAKGLALVVDGIEKIKKMSNENRKFTYDASALKLHKLSFKELFGLSYSLAHPGTFGSSTPISGVSTIDKSTSNTSSKNIVNKNITNINVNHKKYMLSIPSYAGGVA